MRKLTVKIAICIFPSAWLLLIPAIAAPATIPLLLNSPISSKSCPTSFSMPRSQAQPVDLELADEISKYYTDPLGFVIFAYPWGEPGPLEGFAGPDKWQADFLRDLGSEVKRRAFNGRDPVEPIRMAISSGHGIGKTTLVAWIVNWIMSTRPHAQGTISANTFTQLETKTWAQIDRWTRLCITAHWFRISGGSLYYAASPKTWFCNPQSCKEENSEAFAGQHAVTSTSFYVFDEASAISDKIYEVAEGGLTDGEPMIFLMGNATRSNGKFHRVTFGSERERWNQRSIDSRECALTNKIQIAQWVQDYGEDSDFVRVRVKGLPPRASDLQYIDSDRVYDAQKREPQCLPDDPIICGVDVARGGSAANVIRFRKGFDARTIPAIRIPGEQTRDSTVMVDKLAAILADRRPDRYVSMMFVDSAFGGPIVNRLHQLGYRDRVQEVSFGSASPDLHYANMRSFMWGKSRDWLLLGAIDNSPTLETDLTGPGYHHNARDQVVLESKEDMQKRGLASPDEADALVLTHARPVAPAKVRPKLTVIRGSAWS